MLERNSLQEQAYDYLRKAIIEKVLQPGHVYSEQSIADNLSVSRTPIREAVIRLRNDGLLETLPGRGFVVRVMDTKEVLETYQIRSAIEGYCAFLLARDVFTQEAHKALKHLDKVLDVHREAQKNTSVTIEDLILANRDFHRTIVEHSKNSFFIGTFHNLYDKMAILGRNTYSVQGRRELALTEHQLLYDAISSGNPNYAYQVAVEHEEIAIRSYLVFINKLCPDELTYEKTTMPDSMRALVESIMSAPDTPGANKRV